MRKINKRVVLVILVLVSFSFHSLLAAKKTNPTPSEKTGPIGVNTPLAKWGACVKDEVNNEWLWFGGTGGLSKTGGLRTWVFCKGKWKEAEYKYENGGIEELRLKARKLYAQVANRYYHSETETAKKVSLNTECEKLATSLEKIDVKGEQSKKLKKDALKIFRKLAGKLKDKLSVKEVAGARDAMMALVKLSWEISPEPPLRCYTAMAFDQKTGKIVLFGGEGVYGAYNDTWIYDCKTRKWSQVHPGIAPSPRLGHGMVAYDGKVYLAGGFEPRGSMSYLAGLWWRLPIDVWCFDLSKQTWTLLKNGEAKRKYGGMQPSLELSISEDGKKLSWNAPIMSYRKKKGEITGSLNLPASDAGTAAVGKPAGSIQVRGLGYDPAWYEKVPPVDEKAFQAKLKKIPSNKWIDIAPPVKHVRRDWGTIILDTDRDQLLHWAGGHSSHCGTDVAHFSLATGRWHIFYTPELPFEAVYSNDGARNPAMSGNRPWGAHTYLSYAYDKISQKMIWAGRHGAYKLTNPCGLWTYDPEQYEWSAPQWKVEGGRLNVERHMTCMAPTPSGVALWGDKGSICGGPSGLWMADVTKLVFSPVVATETRDRTTLPPSANGDRHGMTYDSKRNRVLIMNFKIKEKYKIWAVDLKSKKVTVLEPKGSANFPMALNMARECTYMAEFDQVIIPSRGDKTAPQKTMIYDCAKNEWLEMPSPCSEPDKRGRCNPGYGVSTGIKWDPKRKLLWLVQTDGSVYVMRFDPKTVGLKPLK